VGTPSYMAPEQAAGRSKQVGPASDVYGLGAILYHLLTGGPPFRAATAPETLEQVRTQEPVPPRQSQLKLPRDLETICLKCLEKEPHKRYASAAALADDLRRFLEGKPIEARSAGFVERGWRWCRRRPALAALAGVSAALGLALIGGSLIILALWRKAESEKRQAEFEKRQAQAAEQQARQLLAENETLFAEKEMARRELEDNLGRMRQMLTDYVQVVSMPPLQVDGAQPLRLEILTKAESAAVQWLQQRGDDSEMRAFLAVVLTQEGILLFHRGQQKEALVCVRRALEQGERLPRREASKPQHRNGLAGTWAWLGHTHEHLGEFSAALKAFDRASALWRELAEEHPSEAAYLGNHKLVQQDYFRVLVATKLSAEELVAAEQVLKDLMDKAEALAKRLPAKPDNAVWLVDFWLSVSATQLKMGQRDSARDSTRRAAAVLSQHDPGETLEAAQRPLWASRFLCVGHDLRGHKQFAEGLKFLERANQLYQQSYQGGAEQARVGLELGESWYQIGKAHYQMDQYDEAFVAFRQCVAVLKRIHEQAPSVGEYRQKLSLHWLRVAYWLSQRGKLAEAAECLSGVERLWPEDAERLREVAEDWRKLAAAIGQGRPELTPAEQVEGQRYRDAGDRLQRKADALIRDQTKPASEGLTPPVRQ